MSWKATAFVNDIVGGITRSEKLVLFTLADFHHTVNRAAWPSLDVLAENCLLSVRHLRRVLDSLEKKEFIRSMPGRGRGNFSCYEITGLDYVKGDEMSSFKLREKGTQKGTKRAVKEDISRHVIRKERVEPVTTPVIGARKDRPTLEEVRAYCKERGNKVNPEAWFDSYVAKGWMIGRSPMKDWRAAVRTWENNGFGNGGNGNGTRKSTGAVHNTHENTERYTKGAHYVVE